MFRVFIIVILSPFHCLFLSVLHKIVQRYNFFLTCARKMRFFFCLVSITTRPAGRIVARCAASWARFSAGKWTPTACLNTSNCRKNRLFWKKWNLSLNFTKNSSTFAPDFPKKEVRWFFCLTIASPKGYNNRWEARPRQSSAPTTGKGIYDWP